MAHAVLRIVLATVVMTVVNTLPCGSSPPANNKRIVFYTDDTYDYRLMMLTGDVETVIASGGEPIYGPGVDRTHTCVYFIRRDPATKYNTVSSTDVYHLERYNWVTGMTQKIYSNSRANFPALDGARFGPFQMTFDENSQIVYWIRENPGTNYGQLWSLNVSNFQGNIWTDAATAGVMANVNGFYPLYHWWAWLRVDCRGAVYVGMYNYLKKYDPVNGFVDFLSKSKLQDTSGICKNVGNPLECLFLGMTMDDTNEKMYYAHIPSYQQVNIRRMHLDGTNDELVYSDIRYEVGGKGTDGYSMTIATMELDSLHEQIYLSTFWHNSGGRTIIRAPINTTSGYVCLYGQTTECKFRGDSELIVGNEGVANYLTGSHSTHYSWYSPGWHTRFPADGSSNVIVIPSMAGPTAQCGAKRPRPTNIATGATCGDAKNVYENERRVFYTEGYTLKEMTGQGIWWFCGVAQCYPEPESEGRYTVTTIDENPYFPIIGPAIDRYAKHLYYFMCSHILGSHACDRYELKRYNYETKTHDQIFEENVWQFGGPNIFASGAFQIAFDHINQRVYWNAGYGRTTDQTVFTLDLKDYVSSTMTPRTRCDIEPLFTFPSEGSIYQYETDCYGALYLMSLSKIRRYNTSDSLSSGTHTVIVQTSSGDHTMRGIAIDDTTKKLYFSYQKNSIEFEIRRVNMVDGSNLEVLYSKIVYERAVQGQFIMDLAMDSVNQWLYALTYYGNSAERSILRVPVSNITSPQVACLFGHKSIPYAKPGNADCVYQGLLEYTFSEMEVTLPYGGVQRTLGIGTQMFQVVPGNTAFIVSSEPLNRFITAEKGSIAESNLQIWYDITSQSPYHSVNTVRACAKACLEITRDAKSGENLRCEAFSIPKIVYIDDSSGFGSSGQCYLYSGRISELEGTNLCSNNMYTNSELCASFDYYERNDLGIDCKLSEWGEWSTCSNVVCGVGTKTRSRTITVNVTSPGFPCEDLIETDVCNETKIITTITPTITTEQGSLTGGSLTGAKMCYGNTDSSCSTLEKCVDHCVAKSGCVAFSFKASSQYCTTYTKKKGATSSINNYCVNSPTHNMCTDYVYGEIISPALDCQVGVWSNWTECNMCNESNRFREVVQEPTFGGQDCLDLEEIESCEYVSNTTIPDENITYIIDLHPSIVTSSPTSSPIATSSPTSSPTVTTEAPTATPLTGTPTTAPTTTAPTTAAITGSPTATPLTGAPTTTAPPTTAITGAPTATPLTGTPTTAPTTTAPTTTAITGSPTATPLTGAPTTTAPTTTAITGAPTTTRTTTAPTITPLTVSPTTAASPTTTTAHCVLAEMASVTNGLSLGSVPTNMVDFCNLTNVCWTSAMLSQLQMNQTQIADFNGMRYIGCQQKNSMYCLSFVLMTQAISLQNASQFCGHPCKSHVVVLLILSNTTISNKAANGVTAFCSPPTPALTPAPTTYIGASESFRVRVNKLFSVMSWLFMFVLVA